MPGKYVNTRKPRPEDMKGTIKRILKYMFSFKSSIVFVFLAVTVNTIAAVASSYFIKPLLNNYILPFIGQKNPDLSGMVGMIALMAVVYSLGALAGYIFHRIMVNVSTGTLYKMRNDLFARLQLLPMGYYDTHVHGEIMSHFTNDTDTLRQMLSMTFPQLISSILSVLFTFIIMLVLSPILTGIVIGMMMVMLAVIYVLSSRSQKYFRKVQQAVGDLNGYSEEMIEGLKVVKVFCREDLVKDGFNEINETLQHAGEYSQGFTAMMMPIVMNLSYVTYAICAVAGAMMAIHGTIDLGSIASFLNYSRSFSRPITQLSSQINYILAALAGAERVFKLMDMQPEVDEGKVTLVNTAIDNAGDISESDAHTGRWAWKVPDKEGGFHYVELKGDVRFENVVFGYEKDKTVLRDITLFAKPGQKIALVGSTGAGKTTITNLINRFYDVPDGKIRYDGININRIKKADLRRSLGMVLQDTNLFTGTVKDNIRFGNLEATDEQIVEAAKLANADSFIRRLPNGYDTMLDANGMNLSQGQRQLLSIARAAVANPPVLVLDEATSSIDTRTEHLIEEGMDKLMEGRTVFVIAHRLSTVKNSNAILVLEQGEIIERGNHESLIAEKGRYYQLYTGAIELD